MGLGMKDRQSLTREVAPRYQKARKAEKEKILDEFVKNTGYSRNYAIHILATWGKVHTVMIDGKPIRMVVGVPRTRKARKGKVHYGELLKQVLVRIWALFDYMCGKRLAIFIRQNIALLAAQEEFHIDEELQSQLLTISPATIDRILKDERKKLEIKGRSHTKAGVLLKHQIPIRTFYEWDERKPGFFELDTVAHDGGTTLGEYCWTLTATDVYSGWIELRALPNRAHRWVKEQIELIAQELPFSLYGIDSDNGGEFINMQLLHWCTEHHIQFTRSRANHKNDNCFVEQKNDFAVRRTVGYARFSTPEEYEALQEVYQYLCPLLNFYYPSMKIIEKLRIGARLKKVYDSPKTPYQRLLESPDIDEKVKTNLHQRAAALHPIELKYLLDDAVTKLMNLSQHK